MVAIASTAPAAPSRCPIADFVEDTGIWRARASPSARFRAAVSAASFRGVDVPCAFTYATSSGVIPASASASSIAPDAGPPLGSGAVRW